MWSQTAPSKYVPEFKLGQLTEMDRNIFDMIWICIKCSHKPKQIEEVMTHAQYMWLLVDDVIDRFSTHRSDNFLLGSTFCVYESMVRWYVHGGDWINRGLPHYIVIDRKAEKVLEFHNSACVECGILMRLKLVKGGSDQDNVENCVTHGADVLMEIVLPWVDTNSIVFAGSYFT